MSETLARVRDALAESYAVERELGAGGMATVYLAEDLKHRRSVAIKVLKPEIGAALGKTRFLREIEIAAGLDHPHILPLFDSGEADGLLYYVMPYVEGESLRARLDREKQLPIDDAVQIAREVADALAYAHNRGVVHRDIKPANIMLAGAHARVADFGIARALTAAGGDSLTETGVAIGTPTYMSPEQATGDADVDGRSDLYSLGCVLYEMLTGQPPFTAPSLEQILRLHLTTEPRPVTNLRPAVPPAVTAALMRALAKLPADRFSPAGQFAEALRSPSTTGPATGRVGERNPVAVGTAFIAGSAILLFLIHGLSSVIGLPDWVVPTALVLLMIGLPVVLAASVIELQRATGGTTPGGIRGWLTCRRAWLGGALAWGLLAAVTTFWMVSRTTGVGPGATLLSSGALEERERIILADFENLTTDSTAGATVTELLRVGLSQTPVVTLLDPVQVSVILDMMRRDAAEGLPADVALEAALREAIGAVVLGEVRAVGTSLAVTARVVSADGTVLVAHQETAATADELIAAVDRLSSRLRERIGESLRSIRRTERLERVTTGSMPALRLYSQGMQAWNQGDVARAMQLFEESIADDSAFAMAHRKLAIILSNNRERRARSVEAVSNAYEHRDRLTERERYTVTAAYHSVVTGDVDQLISAYRTLLDAYPDYYLALNNLGVVYGDLRDYERAVNFYGRALAVDSTIRLHYSNLANSLGMQRLFDSASVIIDRFENRFEDNPEVVISRIINAAQRKDYPAAEQLGNALMEVQRGVAYWEATAFEWMGSLAAMRGQLELANTHWAEAFDLTASRGVGGLYLQRAARRAVSETLLTGDAGVGQRFLNAALERFPLAELSPLDRPYPQLALAYATAELPDRARELLAEFESTPEADHAPDAERWASGARGAIALAEDRPAEAVTEFRRFDDGNSCETCAYAWLARSFDRAGQADSAVAYYEKLADTPSSGIWYDAAHLGYGYRRVAEILDAQGAVDRATDYYARFVNLWEDADPPLRPQVEAVRSRLAALSEEGR